MVRMIPPTPREGANASEKKIFNALESLAGCDDWIVIHSLKIARHRTAFTGEVDFIVLAPGRGILLIEAKSPSSVRYENGDWELADSPSPRKNPLDQLDGARRSIRGYLKELGLLVGNEPVVRLVWFTSLGRHQFENASPGDLQLFEWELGWRDDLSKAKWLIDHVFTEHDSWYSQVTEVEHDPAALTAQRISDIEHALLGNFHVTQLVADRMREREIAEASLLAEQEFVLDLVGHNQHIYLDGPAGTGKTHLIEQVARKNNRAGIRTLVLSWNLLIAQEFESKLGGLPNVTVFDFNSLMLSIMKLPDNPADADKVWYTETLPSLAQSTLLSEPDAYQFEAILVDEFQDIAGMPQFEQLLRMLCLGAEPSRTKIMLAGDKRQQIMREITAQVSPHHFAQQLLPAVVHVKLARNCRNTPEVTSGAEKLTPGRSLGFTGHRMPSGIPGGFEIRNAEPNDTTALIEALRELLQEYAPEQIVILSPFAEHRSLVGRFLARTERSRGERWLRKQLASLGTEGTGRIRWRSVFKFKGLDADAVILTDIGETAKEFTAEHGLSYPDLLYVAVTRAKYRCIVLRNDPV